MARKPRDYKAEYQRRIERGQRMGFSRSQSRGHPTKGEKSIGFVREIRRAIRSDSKEFRRRIRERMKSVSSNPSDWADLLTFEGISTRHEAYTLFYSP